MVVAGFIEVRAIELDIDKMPLPGASVALPNTASIRVRVFVGPH
jgi:hypothetical protein